MLLLSKGLSMFPRLLVILLAMVGLESATTQETAQLDPVKLVPDQYRIVLENSRVRVIENTIRPTDVVPRHSHPVAICRQYGKRQRA